MAVEIGGGTAPGWDAVRKGFERNFAERGEVGASVAVLHRGVPVVDLWGGLADPATGRPWHRDTVVAIASTTKALVSITVLSMVERGELELDRPVAEYWPAFRAEGKGGITLRTVLAHRSGVVSLEHRPITREGLAAGTPVFEAIASARPQWEPGTAHGYHGVTFGHLLSAVVEGVTGRTVGALFAERIARPLGADCHIGLPESELPRLAALVLPGTAEEVELGSGVAELAGLYQGLADPSSLTYRALYGSMRIGWESAADPAYSLLEAPSTDGVASAAGLARLFAATIGEVGGVRLIGPALVREAAAAHSSGRDRVLGIRTDWGLGFMVPGGPFVPRALPAGAFGHGGATGSFAFADPAHELSFGYAPNRGSELLEGNDLRVNTLVDAVYDCLHG
ncbi:serine hydrolase domain-containing protein [Allonocardiopsis opalescens]|uniref:CubicO group peptidase (Beta-lactamase class C family) n=1 Tax=Allonocardiopsis opalescens TaxID=1144618 RepID=A0A2T0Q1N1_9ACTN|nr:serine hydrolase domain-containing protein [Allonocardiopsis opalescens]PRX97705.1 CubicO group peptidase (beta-lactamase class C family) [Allonocardiopsis opalescens]